MSRRRTVTVEAGITYGQLCPYLDRKGFALHNLASLPHISIAGACSTATHGSGEKNGNLATAVSALEFVTAAGDVMKLSRKSDGEAFRGAVVGLGALGVITRITLDVQPTYTVRQFVYENMPLNQMKDHFDDIQASGYSVSLFTDWQKQRINEVWIKSRVGWATAVRGAPQSSLGAKLATRNLHPDCRTLGRELHGADGRARPLVRAAAPLPHGLHSERRERTAVGILRAAPERRGCDSRDGAAARPDRPAPADLRDPHHRGRRPVDEHRYGRQSVAIHFTWKQDWPAVRRLLPVIEKELSPISAAPHWGKLFTLSPAELRSRYEKLDDFLQLAKKYDPKGKFRNDFLNTNLFSG